MKLADLQLAIALQQRLAALDEWPAGEAVLSIDGQEPLLLDADELAELVEWRRGRIKAELRRLGVDTGDAAVLGGFAADVAQRMGRPEVAAAHIVGTLTREAAYAEARAYFLAEHQAMLDRGLIQHDEFQRIAGQREGRIRERAEEMLRRPAAAQCEDCGDAASTVVDGRQLCESHAAARPRLVPPAFLAGAAA